MLSAVFVPFSDGLLWAWSHCSGSHQSLISHYTTACTPLSSHSATFSHNGFDSRLQIHQNFQPRNKENLVIANRSNVNSKTKSEKKKKRKKKKNNWQKQIKPWNSPCVWQSFMSLTIIHVIRNHSCDSQSFRVWTGPDTKRSWGSNFSLNSLTLPCPWNNVKVKVTKCKNGVQEKLQQASCCHKSGDG